MSLVIYRNKNEVPENVKYVDCNDAYFNVKTLLIDNDYTRKVLDRVDNAKYLSENEFLDRRNIAVYRERLSTGAKTLLNIKGYPDVCFNVAECGNNALDLLQDLTEGQIVWTNIVMYPIEDYCDISYKGKQFISMSEFLIYVDHEDNEFEDMMD